jgi:hypothetical protein
MTKWEYCIVKPSKEGGEKMLLGFGKEGWELAAVDDHGRYILKRELKK